MTKKYLAYFNFFTENYCIATVNVVPGMYGGLEVSEWQLVEGSKQSFNNVKMVTFVGSKDYTFVDSLEQAKEHIKDLLNQQIAKHQRRIKKLERFKKDIDT